MRVLIFSTILIWKKKSHSKKNWARYCHKYENIFITRYFCRVLLKLIFSRQIFEKSLKYQIAFKIRPVGAELFHAGWLTDMTKLIVAFRNFANAPKKDLWSLTVPAAQM